MLFALHFHFPLRGDIGEQRINLIGGWIALPKLRNAVHAQPAMAFGLRVPHTDDAAPDLLPGTQGKQGGHILIGTGRAVPVQQVPARVGSGDTAHLVF